MNVRRRSITISKMRRRFDDLTARRINVLKMSRFDRLELRRLKMSNHSGNMSYRTSKGNHNPRAHISSRKSSVQRGGYSLIQSKCDSSSVMFLRKFYQYLCNVLLFQPLHVDPGTNPSKCRESKNSKESISQHNDSLVEHCRHYESDETNQSQ
jgi:hypothetical protein